MASEQDPQQRWRTLDEVGIPVDPRLERLVRLVQQALIDPAYNVVDERSRLQVLVADVMGKGLAASLLASGVRSDFRAHSAYVDLGRALHRTALDVEGPLAETGSFVTVWAARVDPATGELEYLDAGHGTAVIVSPRGLRRLRQQHLPLGYRDTTGWRPTSCWSWSATGCWTCSPAPSRRWTRSPGWAGRTCPPTCWSSRWSTSRWRATPRTT